MKTFTLGPFLVFSFLSALQVFLCFVMYAIETFRNVDSKLRAAHRHMTRAAHSRWRQYADLPGPNITNHRLYTAYSLTSLSEIHRHRRNKFLISAESSPNRFIREIIGNLPRITA